MRLISLVWTVSVAGAPATPRPPLAPPRAQGRPASQPPASRPDANPARRVRLAAPTHQPPPAKSSNRHTGTTTTPVGPRRQSARTHNRQLTTSAGIQFVVLAPPPLHPWFAGSSGICSVFT